MRQIPSVTEMTVPCVRDSVVAPRFWMRLLMSSLISDGLSCILRLLTNECARHRVEFSANGRVDHFVADHDLDAADQRRIDADLRAYLALIFAFQLIHQLRDLGIVDREGRMYFRLEHAFLLEPQLLEHGTDFRHNRE